MEAATPCPQGAATACLGRKGDFSSQRRNPQARRTNYFPDGHWESTLSYRDNNFVHKQSSFPPQNNSPGPHLKPREQKEIVHLPRENVGRSPSSRMQATCLPSCKGPLLNTRSRPSEAETHLYDCESPDTSPLYSERQHLSYPGCTAWGNQQNSTCFIAG